MQLYTSPRKLIIVNMKTPRNQPVAHSRHLQDPHKSPTQRRNIPFAFSIAWKYTDVPAVTSSEANPPGSIPPKEVLIEHVPPKTKAAARRTHRNTQGMLIRPGELYSAFYAPTGTKEQLCLLDRNLGCCSSPKAPTACPSSVSDVVRELEQ